MEGLFISVEGGDGSGKSTQLENIKKYFAEKNIEYIFTREPGGTAIGEKIRDILLDAENVEMADITEAMLYAASRAQHVEELIRPALQAGKVVICDRFVDSSLAYQGIGRNLGEMVKVINDYAIAEAIPDVTFFLDISPKDAMSRIAGRGHDRLEREEDEFHQKVYEGYRTLVEEDAGRENRRIYGVDANREPEKVWEDIKKLLDQKLAEKR